jgi:hypothetical protein
MDIVIEIDELVLHGFPPADRYRIGEAVQAELTRILGERGLAGAWTSGAAAVRLDAGSFNVASGMPAAAIGGSAAEAVYRTLNALPDNPGAFK